VTEQVTVKLRINADVGAQSGVHRLGDILGLIGELKPHRQALHDFHPVAGGILGRQHRKLRAGARTQADYPGVETPVRIRIVTTALWPARMWASWSSLKLASIHTLRVETRVKSSTAALM